MMDNLDLWKRHADIDPRMTKPIVGKAYKGTSPSPQHVIWCLTEMFGPAGKGFGWDVTAEGWQPLGDEVLHWCRIRFWHGDRAHGFDAYGQTMALMNTRNGLKADEDAPKKSLTDAIIKAASQLGVAANIFLGRWDDQKYVAEVAAQYRDDPPPFDAAAAADRIIASVGRKATVDDLSDLWRHEIETVRVIAAASPTDADRIKSAFGARKQRLMLSHSKEPPNEEYRDRRELRQGRSAANHAERRQGAGVFRRR